MMKFILNFFIFGFIFYLISVYFPDIFQTLVDWAKQALTFFTDAFHTVVPKNEPVLAPPKP